MDIKTNDKTLIRPARPGDESKIHESHMRSIREVCVVEHGAEEVRGWGSRPLGDRWVGAIKEGHVWVVEQGKAICGHGYIRIFTDGSDTKAHIMGLYLNPEVVRQGLGAKLATLMIDKARACGAKTITLESTLTGHAFYEHMGFADTGAMIRSNIGGSSVRSLPMQITL